MKWLLLILAPCLWAIPTRTSIPRSPLSYTESENQWKGGSSAPADIENLRSSWHPEGGYERWVFDFSDVASNEIGKLAPRFQVRYIKGQHPKFLIEFSSIRRNKVVLSDIKKLLSKSKFVKEITFYPPIEEGEVAVEFVLNQSLSFSLHQPREKEGRLVLDLKQSPKGK